VLHAFYARETHAVQTPYLIIGAVVVGLALLILWSRFPTVTTQGAATTELSFIKSVAALFSKRRFLFGVVAQFFYVGAQVGVWSYTIKYAQAETGQADKAAVVFLIYNYVAFTIGRFGGASLMRVLPPTWIFSTFAVFNIVLATLAATLGGWSGLWCLVGTSLFMSVMYPTIFAVSLEGLGELTKSASSLLVMSIIGGAIITPVMGLVSDRAHLIRIALYVPAACFAFLAVFGLVLSYLKSHSKSADRIGDFATSMGG
jgi:FHS family L-fucose permease-like MFS transporter